MSHKQIEECIIGNLIKHSLIDFEDIDMYRFGLECFFIKICHYIFYILIAAYLGRTLEFFSFIGTYLSIRKCAGGIHSNTRLGCFFISNIVLIMVLWFGNKCDNLFVLTIATMISAFILLIFAPVDNPNRRLTILEKSKFKKYTFTVISLEIIIVSFLLQIKETVEFAKWITIGIIISACVVMFGKIKYEVISTKK